MAVNPTTPAKRRSGSRGANGHRSANGAAPGTPDQGSRLLKAIVEIVARDGYPEAKIGDLAERAGVSRATFYELFANKEACLLAAHRELGDKMIDVIGSAVAHGESSRAAQSALGALVEFADREPLSFNFLMHEAMLAGSQAVDQRDRLVRRLELTIEHSWEQAPDHEPVLDMSAKILLEGTVRLLGLRIRDETAPRLLLSDLLAWFDSYAVRAGSPRWREFVPNPALSRPPHKKAEAPALRRSLPKGRHRLGAEVVKSVQRERIVYATAEAIRVNGYANFTVADIVATAGLSRDVFYAHFHDKQEAFEGTVQLVFERLLATMAGAFFGSSGAWPDQVWEAAWAFVRFLEGDPSLAHFLFVGTYAPPTLIKRVNDFVLAFTVFVESGNNYPSQTAWVSRTVSEAIVCSVLEAVTFRVRHDRVAELRGLIPSITNMVFVPFMGAEAAGEFLESKVKAAQTQAAAGSVP
jgi:AcrR family transcriptional regulator